MFIPLPTLPQELDPSGIGECRYISPDLLCFEHGGEAALVLMPPHLTPEGSRSDTLGVLAFNLPASIRRAPDTAHLQLTATRLLFLADNHCYHCSATADLHILVLGEGATGAGGAYGQLLGFNPAGTPGFRCFDMAGFGNILPANTADQVSL